MMRRFSVGMLCVAFVLSISNVPAQGPPPGPGPNPMALLANFFGLSEVQINDLQHLLETRRTTIQPLHEQVNAKQQELRGLFESGSPDATAVGTLAIEIHDLQQQIGGAAAEFQAGFASLLTEEQAQKYQALKHAKRLQPIVHAAGQVGVI